jgi:signal transduction histidine kinase
VLKLRSRERRLATALADSQQAQTALREAMSALETMHEELVANEKLSSLGMIAAGVAHEINNPMAYVTMNVHTLLEDLRDTPNLPEALRGYVDDLLPSTIDGISRVNTIVRDLQQFARGDTDVQADFELNNEIEAAARISKNQLKGRVKLNLALEPLPSLHGKPRQLTQVMVNLIVNAVHAIGDRIDGRIDVASGVAPDGSVLVTIRDNGCGMSDDVKARVFQPFFTTKEVGRGTGLGLSVVFGIVEAHGGTIELSSTVDVGTTFTLRFPVGRAETKNGAPEDAVIAA